MTDTRQGRDRAARLRALSAPGWARLRAGSALSVLAGLVWLAQAALIADSLGALLAGRVIAAWPRAAALFALFVLRAGLGLLADRLTQAAAEDVVHQARTARLAAALHGQGAQGAGQAAALAVEKLDLLGPYVQRYRPAQFRVAVLPLLIAALALWQSWAVALILLVAGPLIPVFMALVGMAARDASARQLAQVGTLNDLLVERLSALVDLRLIGAGDAVARDFRQRSGDVRARTFAVLRLAFLSSTVLELFSAIGVAMVAVYVGFTLLGLIDFGTWGAGMTPAAGIFLLLIAPEFFQPLRDLAAAWHDKASAEAVADELITAEVAPVPADLLGSGGPAPALSGPAWIEVAPSRLPDGRQLPGLRVGPGQGLALTGASGSGKTTLLRRIAGLEGGPGGVTVGGQPLTDDIADAWRAGLGWMPQAPHFLPESLRANVAMGRPGGGDTVAAALDRAAFTPVLARLPRGLDTRLGATGAGLSGGEARRLMLARAIFGNPRVILADEPTADLDPATAARIRAALSAEVARGATLIVATHDPELAAMLDRTLDLADSG
ncbi:ABC transporter ATP-binding protein/permease [Paracoccus sp. p3-h83]|uniref:ABC transporter ATP-binding protein/permease n=1 Tax=Paracoccus sp. p3-h83 TaxID=3342805 RepID=UPI0035BA6F11